LAIGARIYSDKIEMQMPWGLEAFKIDADGSFSGRISGTQTLGVGNTFTRLRWSIQGNIRSKDVRFESLSYYRCSWNDLLTADIRPKAWSVDLGSGPDGRARTEFVPLRGRGFVITHAGAMSRTNSKLRSS
jgi:hypothetical protein